MRYTYMGLPNIYGSRQIYHAKAMERCYTNVCHHGLLTKMMPEDVNVAKVQTYIVLLRLESGANHILPFVPGGDSLVCASSKEFTFTFKLF